MPTWTLLLDQDFSANADTAPGTVPAPVGGTGSGAWTDVAGSVWQVLSGRLVSAGGAGLATELLKRPDSEAHAFQKIELTCAMGSTLTIPCLTVNAAGTSAYMATLVNFNQPETAKDVAGVFSAISQGTVIGSVPANGILTLYRVPHAGGGVDLTFTVEDAANPGVILQTVTTTADASASLQGPGTYGLSHFNAVSVGRVRTWYGASSMSASPASTTQGTAGLVFVVTGVNTAWSGSPISVTNSVTGTTTLVIDSQTVDSPTQVTVHAHTGTGTGTYAFTDGTLTTPGTVTPANAVTLTAPTAYQSYQQDSDGVADVPIAGTYTFVGTPSAIEASFDGSDYRTIAATPTGGTFSGTFTGASGCGTLTVRFANDAASADTKAFVNVADILLLAGQSNMTGQALLARTFYSTGTTFPAAVPGLPVATKFTRAGAWAVCSDPVDSSGGAGSYGPDLATILVAGLGFPVALVPVSQSGQGLADWQKAGGSGVYQTALDRFTASGGAAKAMLYHGGETDAAAGSTQAEIYDLIVQLAADVLADFGVRIILCKLQQCTAADVTDFNLAVQQAWDAGDVDEGPDLSDESDEDGSYHLKSPGAMYVTGARWAYRYAAVEYATAVALLIAGWSSLALPFPASPDPFSLSSQ